MGRRQDSPQTSVTVDDSQQEKLAQEVNGWIREALDALRAGRLDSAKELFLKVTHAAPHFSEAYYNLGVIFDLQKNTDEAIRYYSEALKHNPKHAECLTNLGAAHSNAGRHAIAVPFFNRAIQNNPNLLQPRLNLGITYRNMEQPARALEALKGALTVDPQNPYVLYLAGCAAQESGFHTDAERFLQAALAAKPDYTDALIILVDVLLDLEDPARAVESLESFIRRNPNNETARDCLRRIRSADMEN